MNADEKRKMFEELLEEYQNHIESEFSYEDGEREAERKAWLNKYDGIKEPLFKDEKIRKAVRAWADANGLNYLNCYESAHAWYLRAFNKEEQGIDIYFWGYQLPKELTNCTTYTIAELCGEEEE